MKKYLKYFLVGAFMLLAQLPALAQAVDLAGPWILDYPHGKGMLILQNTGGNQPKYTGELSIPNPSNPQASYVVRLELLSIPSYVVPGNNITFSVTSGGGIQFLIMNVSSSSAGVAWILTHGGADNNLIKMNSMKVYAHR